MWRARPRPAPPRSFTPLSATPRHAPPRPATPGADAACCDDGSAASPLASESKKQQYSPFQSKEVLERTRSYRHRSVYFRTGASITDPPSVRRQPFTLHCDAQSFNQGNPDEDKILLRLECLLENGSLNNSSLLKIMCTCTNPIVYICTPEMCLSSKNVEKRKLNVYKYT